MCLERLDRATKVLGERVHSLSQVVRISSTSLEFLGRVSSLSSAPEILPVGPCITTMVRTCHGCHAPLDEEHQAHPSGWQKCQLEHWEGCKGGILDGKSANGSDWRGCPDGYVHVESVDDDSVSGEDTEEEGLKDSDITLAGGDQKAAESVIGDKLDDEVHTDKSTHLEVDDVVEETNTADEHDGGDAEKLLQQLQSTNLLLKQQAAVREQQEKAERERKIAMLRVENSKLSKSMQGDTGGAKVKSTLGPLQPNPRNRRTGKQLSVSAKIDASKTQSHLSRSQLAAAEYRPDDASLYSGLNIKGIRKIPDIQAQVEMLIGAVQNLAPSLDSRPSFVPDKPPVKSTVPAAFSASSFSAKSVAAPNGGDDPETSSDDDFDEAPRPGYVFRWRRDANGEKYNVEEKLSVEHDAEADLVYRYVRDEATGRSYKKLVLKDDPEKELVPQWVVNPETGKKVKMLVPSQQSSRRKDVSRAVGSPSRQDKPFTGCVDGFATPFPPRAKPSQLSSSAPSRTSAALQEEKQGKMPSIVHYARECPVSWTNKITTDKLNMGLWCWAFVSELLATRTGQAPPLQHGELEARLQHFLNVLEIALQPGNSSDFDNHAWRVARLYAEKVQQKVERGDTWLGFEMRYGSDSQPHELMAAEKELAPKVTKKKEEERVKTKEEIKKRSCTTWNTSSVEGKCEYEIQNDGRNCSRRHECTWCKDKGKRSLSHQRSFCRLRIAAGEQ